MGVWCTLGVSRYPRDVGTLYNAKGAKRMSALIHEGGVVWWTWTVVTCATTAGVVAWWYEGIVHTSRLRAWRLARELEAMRAELGRSR